MPPTSMAIQLTEFVGPAAGIATSLLWTLTSLQFTEAGKRLGPVAVNAVRIVMAIVLHACVHRALTGRWIPEATAAQVGLLALSGIIGLSIGDQALFTAFVDIGPRLSMLIMTTAPLFAALFGWAALGERLPAIAWVGIGLTIGGVAWVVCERPVDARDRTTRHRLRGVILAFVGAACQAGGLLLSKQGMGHGILPEDQHIAPQTATFIRMMFGGIGVAPIVAIHAARQRRRRAAGLVPRRIGSVRGGLLFAAGGAVVGPFLGVWMSLVASDRVEVGIAQTLCSLPPVFILPFVVLIYNERVSPRAAIGAVVAVAGAAMLFLEEPISAVLFGWIQ
jgi:drug/metabolite transporter (DMT)-like permease